MVDAVVVGAGPNGLAAAVTLAQHGLKVSVLEASADIGGGTRTSELTAPGVLHDHCSAVHPMGIGSPFLSGLDLEGHGLTWRWPQIDLAHPLDDGSAGVMAHLIGDTAAGLGVDGPAWTKLFGPLASGFDDLVEDLMQPVAHLPRHPVQLARFGVHALQPATVIARRFKTDQARALFGGTAAHAMYPLGRPMGAAVGVTLTAACHRFGWPVAQGGSRAITDALASVLTDLGGTIKTDEYVGSLVDLPSCDLVMLDLAPSAVADIAGDALPPRVRRAYRRWRHGPGVFKLDLAIDGDVPWTNEACRRAGTVHLGGTYEEIAAAELAVARGQMPDQPFVLLSQQYLADPTRSAGSINPLWAYAHVPHGYTGDATDAILAQLERFAPGLRQQIVGQHTRSTAELEAYNPNYIGGDILTGQNTPLQMVMRPRVGLNPYSTAIPGVYICSAATPPGAGVHGMCGHNAARAALRAPAAQR